MKRLYILILVLLVFNTTNAQTPVSGGIYSNTTWTQANSPYIVTADVVVFPGVTLTIQPGVTVKFDNGKQLEIRQAKLIAIGTITDSIIFTSNSASPTPGIWNRIYFYLAADSSKFNYCRFSYATYGIYYLMRTIVKNSLFKMNTYGGYIRLSNIDSCVFIQNNTGLKDFSQGIITNSRFNYNVNGMDGIGYANIHNCDLSGNQYGIFMMTNDVTIKGCVINSNTQIGVRTSMDSDSIINCQIKNNAIGVYNYRSVMTRNTIENNGIGIKGVFSSIIFCNKICNNTSYDYYNEYSQAINISQNYWCTNNSNVVAAHIYDGYDDPSKGLVTFMPIDTSQCYLTGCNLHVTATVTNATCDTCHNGTATAHIAYGIPPYTYTWYTTPLQTTQTATGLAPGNYTVCAVDAMGCSACNYNVYIDSTNCTGYSISAQGNNSTCNTCNDGTAGVTITGGTPPYSYSWYTIPMQNTVAVTNLLPGTYGVCVTDVYGCVSCDSVTINTGNCSAHFNLFPDSIVLHQYYAVNMASGVTPLTYLWQWGDGTTSTGPYPTHTYATAGFYAICLDITDAVGCTNHYCNSYYLQKSTNSMIGITVIPQITTGNNELSLPESISIYPNPSTGLINITFAEKAKDTKLEVMNSCGQVLLSKEINNSTQTTLDLSNQAKGMYFIKMQSGSGVVVRKVIICE